MYAIGPLESPTEGWNIDGDKNSVDSDGDKGADFRENAPSEIAKTSDTIADSTVRRNAH